MCTICIKLRKNTKRFAFHKTSKTQKDFLFIKTSEKQKDFLFINSLKRPKRFYVYKFFRKEQKDILVFAPFLDEH